MERKEIYIIRHGETDFNANGIVQGKGVDASLNPKGVAQAEAFYRAYRHMGFDKLYISTLKRTYETVAPFIVNGQHYERHASLDEIGWGIYEGMNASTAMKSHYKEIVDSWLQGNYDARVPEGESARELQSRQMPFIDLLRSTAFERALVCSHGRAMRSLLCTMLGFELRRMDEFPHRNLSLYKLNLKDGIFELEIWNSREHLDR